MPKTVRKRKKQLTPHQQELQRRLRVRRELRAADDAQRNIERAARQLDRSTARAHGAVAEMVYAFARERGLRIVTRDQRLEEERELGLLRHSLEEANGRIAELERDATNAMRTIERALDEETQDAPRELTVEPV